MIFLSIYIIIDVFIAGVVSSSFIGRKKLVYIIGITVVCIAIGVPIFIWAILQVLYPNLSYIHDTLFKRSKIKKHEEQIKELLK